MRSKCLLMCGAILLLLRPAIGAPVWSGYAGNAQHQAISSVPSANLDTIKWQTPVDLDPQYVSGEYLLIHYGSPMITSANTVVVPVKTGATDGFKIEGRSGTNGALKWTATSDYTLPSHNWTPSYSPTLTTSGRVYYAGAGGTIYYRDNIDSNSPSAPTQIAFFGNGNYAANSSAYNNSVFINTPLTSDAAGNVYFGYQVQGTNPLGLTSGVARIAPDGSTTYTSALAASGNVSGINKVVMNCAPAISNDGSSVYITLSTGNNGSGVLAKLDSATLAPQSHVALMDPRSGGVNGARLPDDGSASPTIGPDGDVYFGVLDNPTTTAKGWMLHFNSSLSTAKPRGAFGWDISPTIVDASLVPSYSGSSPYLIMTKYNNYASVGGDGVNKLAILDPNDTQIDARTGETVMKEILTIAGLTEDDDFDPILFPNAVREWCINTAVVDPATHSILANSEDGKMYRWDLWTNTFTQQIVLTAGIGEAYTPTLVGADGTVYAINNATLFAIVPEPASAGLILAGAMLLLKRRK